MFNKKAIEQIIKEYKKGGILPELWGKDADKITNISKISFLSIFKKIIDIELKDLKKEEENKLDNQGLTTEILVVSWINPSKNKNLTKEGLEYLKTYHPKWIEEKLKKGYFTWKLR